MKKGSGDDPFADVEPDTDGDPDVDDEPVDDPVEPQGSDVEDSTAPTRGESTTEHSRSSTKERYTDSSGGSARGSTTESVDSDSETVADDASTTESTGRTKAEADGIPWVLRRSRVKEDRENVHQFFLREEYSTREDEIIEAVAAELQLRQKDIQKLDVREAMVAAADPTEIAAVLRDWGYEYLD